MWYIEVRERDIRNVMEDWKRVWQTGRVKQGIAGRKIFLL
jgi:hypothetical protein